MGEGTSDRGGETNDCHLAGTKLEVNITPASKNKLLNHCAIKPAIIFATLIRHRACLISSLNEDGEKDATKEIRLNLE